MTPLYKQFNQVESQIAPNEARIAGFQHEIENLRKSNDAERNRISNDKLELITTEAEIKDLRNRLQLAEERKAFLEASIVEATQQIAENTQAIDDAMASIADLEKTIKELRDKADALRAKTTSLEVMVERIRDDVNVAQKKADAINEKIAEYKDQIAAQEKLLVTDDLKLLQDQIVVLKKIQITVEEEVNRQYFYCYGDGAFTIEKTGTVTVYIIRGEALKLFLKTLMASALMMSSAALTKKDLALKPTFLLKSKCKVLISSVMTILTPTETQLMISLLILESMVVPPMMLPTTLVLSNALCKKEFLEEV